MTLEEDKRPYIYSLALHAFILLVMVVKPYFSKEIKPFERTIKVDIVAMPEKNQKIVSEKVSPQAKKTEKSKKKKAAEKPTVEAKTQPDKKEKSASAKPKKVSSQNKAKKDKKAQEEISNLEASQGDALKKLQQIQKEKAALAALEKQKAIAGNRISKGSDLVGVEKLEYSNYKSTLHRAISSEWDLPKWLLESKLQAAAHIRIDHDGNLIEKKLVNSSGNSIYDEKVMEAISDSAPFDPPPEKFKNIVKYEGVLLTFP